MIETMLRLSRAHLSAPSRQDWLESGALVAFDLEHGRWLIPVPDASAQDVPADLAECFSLARANNCDWLFLDSDTPPLSILAVHE